MSPRFRSVKCLLPLLAAAFVSVSPSLALSQSCEDLFKNEGGIASSLRRKSMWTAELVIRALQIANQHGAALNSSFTRKKDESLNKKISDEFGFSVTAPALYQAAIKHFGSWEKALVAAKIDPLKHRGRMKWTPEIVLKGIQVAAEAGADLSAKGVSKTSQPEIDKKISEALGFNVTLYAVYSAAHQQFKEKSEDGAWNQALRKAGLSPLKYWPRMHWNQELLIKAIRILKDLGADLSTRITNSSPEIDAKLSEAFGAQITALGVFEAAQLWFKNDKEPPWDAALRASGIDPTAYWSVMRWSDDLVIKALQISSRLDINVGYPQSYDDLSPELIQKFQQLFGYKVSLNAVRQAAVARWGTIAKAQAIADARYFSFWSRPQIARTLEYLRTRQLLSAEKIENDLDGRISWNLSLATGRFVLGRPFVESVRRVFGSWALGLDLSGVARSRIDASQKSWLESNDPDFYQARFDIKKAAEARQALYLLTDAMFEPANVSNKRLYDRRALEKKLYRNIDLWNEAHRYDRALLTNLLEVWEQRGLVDKDQMLSLLAVKMGTPVKEQQVIELFRQLNTIVNSEP